MHMAKYSMDRRRPILLRLRHDSRTDSKEGSPRTLWRSMKDFFPVNFLSPLSLIHFAGTDLCSLVKSCSQVTPKASFKLNQLTRKRWRDCHRERNTDWSRGRQVHHGSGAASLLGPGKQNPNGCITRQR